MKRLSLLMLVSVCLALLAPAPAAAGLIGGPQQSGVVVIYAPSGPDVTTTSTSWVDVPQMKGNITTQGTSDLAIAFTAEAEVSNNARMFVRATVDDCFHCQ